MGLLLWLCLCDVTKRTMAANTSHQSDESSESFDLMMEGGSSSFEEMDDIVPLNTHLYLFEPEASSDEEFNQQSPYQRRPTGKQQLDCV